MKETQSKERETKGKHRICKRRYGVFYYVSPVKYVSRVEAVYCFRNCFEVSQSSFLNGSIVRSKLTQVYGKCDLRYFVVNAHANSSEDQVRGRFHKCKASM